MKNLKGLKLIFIIVSLFFSLQQPPLLFAEMTSAMIDAIKTGNVIKIKKLLNDGANVNDTDKDGVTALILASMAGSVKTVQALAGSVKTVQALIDNGADLNIQEKVHQGTALMYAVLFNHIEVAEALLGGKANVNSKNKDGRTALILSIDIPDIKMIRLLLKNGADINLKDKDGKTALWYASKKGLNEIVKLLKEYGG